MTTLDLLKVVNTDKSKPLILRHDGKGDVTIEPGRHRILPAEYAYLSFGHPRAFNQGKNKERDQEFRNARTMWGFYDGVYPEAAWEGVGVTAEGDEIGPFKPQFECYDMDDERVFMVIEDPDGTLAASLGGAPTTDQSDRIEQDAMQAQIAAQARQIEELRNLILLGQQGGLPGLGGDIPEPESDDDEEDDEDEEEEEEAPEEPAKTAKRAPRKATATKAKAGTQAARNEKRDEIPVPPDDEPAVTADNPKVTRIGKR